MTLEGLVRRWFGNSLVNLIGGLATAGVAVLLPAVVVHHLTVESFAIWNLAMQIIVYVGLLSMGLQTATSRAVAHAAEGGAAGMQRLPVIMRAARSIAGWASGVAFVLVAVLVVAYPLLFPRVPPSLVGEFRLTLALFGLAALPQILAQPEMGLFQGLHRNVVFVGVQMGVRLLTVLLVWLGAREDQPMIVLAMLVAVATATVWPAMRMAAASGVPWSRQVATSALDPREMRELLQYCGTLSVWSLSMLLVNSAGIVIVGRLDFPMAGPYAIAMTATSVVVGLLGAALSPLMPNAAALHVTDASRSLLPRLLQNTTVGIAVVMNLLVVGVTALYPFLLRTWVGDSFVPTAGPLLIVLVAGHCLRNICAPYSLMLLAIGAHRRALISAALEGGTNFVASIVFGLIWGAVGVAYGTLVGAVIGVVGTLALNTGRTPELTPHPFRFSAIGFLIPVIVFAPIHFLVVRWTVPL